MTIPHYSPYCGNNISRDNLVSGCHNPRTVWNKDKQQFVCPNCGFTTEFPEDFITRYIKYRESGFAH